MEITRELYARLRRKGLVTAHAAARSTLAIGLSQRSARVLHVEESNSRALDNADPRPIAVFAHHAADHRVDPGVRLYLDALRAVSSAIVFVSTSERLDPAEIGKHVDVVIVRSNVGYDFGSWKIGLARAGDAVTRKGVLLANDSVFGPRAALGPFVERMKTQDVWGFTDSHEIAPHLQTYFLGVSTRAAAAPWFRAFWSRVVQLPNEFKSLVVRLYEVGFSTTAYAAGFRPAACFETADLAARHPHCARPINALNPTANFWRELVTDEGLPFLKRGMLRPENRASFDAADIDAFVAKHFSGFTDRP